MLTLGIRPDDLTPGEGDIAMPYKPEVVERPGNQTVVHGTTESDVPVCRRREERRIFVLVRQSRQPSTRQQYICSMKLTWLCIVGLTSTRLQRLPERFRVLQALRARKRG